MRGRGVLTGLLLAACGATAIPAQELGEQRIATSMLTFLKIGQGARAVAMGEAFAPVADDATAMYWNPAGLALLQERRVHVTHTEWPADIDYESLFFTMPAPFLGGGLGVQVSSLRTTLDHTTELEPLPTGRTFDYSDFLLAVGGARQFTDRFAFGLTLKYVREDLGSDVGGSVVNSWAADIGTMFQLPYREFRMSMAWTNAGPDFQPPGGYTAEPASGPSRDVQYQSFSPASVFAFGASMQPVQTRYATLLASLQFDHPADNHELIKMGGELRVAESMAFRAGWNPRSHEMRFSAGFGLRGSLGKNAVSFDYAYTDGNALGRIDRFSMEIEF